MKKQITIAALALGAFVLGINNVQAQSEAKTEVNLILSHVIYMERSAPNVTFTYPTAEEYNKEQEQDGGTLTVTSSKKFDINVKTQTEFFTGGNNDIPVSILEIRKKSGTMDKDFESEFTLSNQVGISLVKGAPIGAEKTLNIQYFISADNAKTVLLGKEATNYTQVVTYTATAD